MVLVIIQNEMTLRIILDRGKVLLQYAVLTLNHHFGVDRHNKLIDLYGIFLLVLSTKTLFSILWKTVIITHMNCFRKIME